MPSGNSSVLYQVDDGICWVTINRPEVRNALDRATIQALWDAFRRFDQDEDTAVAVLTAAGDQAFSAGGDLKEMAETGLQVPPPFPHLGHNLSVAKPVIAAVNGVAYAGGFLLAQMVDLCVAADHALFAITEAKWGRGAPWAATLPWLLPRRVVLELLLTGTPIDAARAHALGFVNTVVPGTELRATAASMAAGIRDNAPLSVRAAKAMVEMSANCRWDEATDRADRLYEHVYLSEDAQEGPRAFRERRTAIWTGR